MSTILDKIKFPGETFQIPSRGIFYTPGVEILEDVKNGELTVYPMTTIDEITIKSPDMLFSGKAIEEVFKRCIPQVLNSTRLLAKDVEFLMICLRKVAYGDSVHIDFNHKCSESAKDRRYNASIVSMIRNTVHIDPTAKFSIVLDQINQKVVFEPVRFDEYIALSQNFVENSETTLTTTSDIMDRVTTMLLPMVASVDGETDKNVIGEWLKILPVKQMKQLTDKIAEMADWGPSYLHIDKCKDCGEEIRLEIPLNPIHFFTLD